MSPCKKPKPKLKKVPHHPTHPEFQPAKPHHFTLPVDDLDPKATVEIQLTASSNWNPIKPTATHHPGSPPTNGKLKFTSTPTLLHKPDEKFRGPGIANITIIVTNGPTPDEKANETFTPEEIEHST